MRNYPGNDVNSRPDEKLSKFLRMSAEIYHFQEKIKYGHKFVKRQRRPYEKHTTGQEDMDTVILCLAVRVSLAYMTYLPFLNATHKGFHL